MLCGRYVSVSPKSKHWLRNTWKAERIKKVEIPFLINEILSEDELQEALLAVGYLSPKSIRH